MSFSYVAAGPKARVIEQLDHQAGHCSNGIGRVLASTLSDFLADPDEGKSAFPDHDLVYVVKASGHSGAGSTLSLNATVEAHHVRATSAHEPITTIGADTGHGAAGTHTTHDVAL